MLAQPESANSGVTMPPTSKRLAAGEDELDRLSNLPKEIWHSILDCMPVSDAAKTSILSRDWRYIWMSHPNLVFNQCWYGKIMKRSKTEDELFHVINKLQHIGNIDNFTLHIPNSSSRIDQWMLFLSRNGKKASLIKKKIPICCLLAYYAVQRWQV